MIVRCANCQTEFSLDDRKVGPEGSAVRCTVCGYVFRVDPPAHAAADQPWQIRTVEDLLFTAPDLATLRAWIGEGRLHPDDHVSRTGKHWVRLGDMSEFSDAFAEFQELPKVVEPVPGATVSGPSERSAADELGPPPAFGTGASESSGPSVFAAVAPLAETHTEQLSVAIDEAVSRDAAPRSLSRTASEGIVVGRVGETGPHALRDQGRERAAPQLERTPAEDPPAASMLDIVSRNVKPIPAKSTVIGPQPESDPAPPIDEVESLSDTLPRGRRTAEPVEDALEIEPNKRKTWPLVAGLGLVAGIAVAFGVPDVRERVLTMVSGTRAEPEEAPVVTLELPSVDSALQKADPVAIGKAEAELQARIDGGGEKPTDVATMKLAQVELLTTRALTFQIQAAVDSGAAERASKNASDDAARAAEIFDQVETDDVIERDRIRTARARLRLVQGRPPEEIVALLPDGAEELRQVVTAAPLWRDSDAKVPEGSIAALTSVTNPSATAQLVLALAYLRSGDDAQAGQTIESVLATTPEQPAALALKRAASGEASDPEADADAKKPEVVADATPVTEPSPQTTDAAPKETAKDGASASKPTSAGPSIDRLIDRGCDLVDSGKASEGIEMLQQAEQRRPSDLDVLVCLGLGYSKQGKHSNALRYFEKALARNPGYGAALRGAARAAKASGNTQKAVEYYQRVLKIEPRNAEAREYVEANIGGG